MNDNQLNPYESPATINAEGDQERFRLRPWFATAMYLALLFDLAFVWAFGFQPLLASIGLFMLSLGASVFIRRYARIHVLETGILYEDLVQRIDVPWRRVARVIHRPSKTVVATPSLLAQITVGRSHAVYDLVVSSTASAQIEFGFEVTDFRT